MSFSRSVTIPLFATALSLLAAGPALAATASSPGVSPRYDSIPPDCSTEGILPATLIMTCNNRPPTQHWQVGADCYDFNTGGYDFKLGRVATGDDYSAITGCYPRKNIGFFVVS